MPNAYLHTHYIRCHFVYPYLSLTNMAILSPYKLLLVILTFTCSIGNSQPYTFHNYSLADGLPQSQVGCALTDSRGYLWAGTEGGGLCRYNGDRFIVFTMEDQLPSNYIRAIHQQENYKLWIGTSRGLCSYDGHHFSPVRGVNTAITTITGYRDSLLLIGTADGLYLLPAGQDSLHPFILIPIGRILSTYQTAWRSWIGTKDGLWSLTDSASIQRL